MTAVLSGLIWVGAAVLMSLTSGPTLGFWLALGSANLFFATSLIIAAINRRGSKK